MNTVTYETVRAFAEMRQRILAGSATELLSACGDGSVGLVFTDPPWAIPSRAPVGRRNGGVDLRADQPELVVTCDWPLLVRESERILVAGGFALFWCGFHNVSSVLGLCNEHFGFGHNTVVARIVPNPAPLVRGLRVGPDGDKCGGPFISSFDLIVVAHRANEGFERSSLKGYHAHRNVRSAPNPRGAARHEHPAAKPIDLCRELIRSLSLPGDVVVDPYCGSGAILVAAALEGRRVFGADNGRRETGGTTWAEVTEVALARALGATPVEAPAPRGRGLDGPETTWPDAKIGSAPKVTDDLPDW